MVRRRLLPLVASLGLIAGLMAVSTGAVAAAACPPTCYVNVATGNDTTGDGTSGLPYKTINKALSVETSGGTIIVAAGTYPEFVDIGIPITLQGANSGVTCLGTRSAETVITGTTVGAFKIDSDNVVINGFQISDPNDPSSGLGLASGIWMNATKQGALITNNLITGNIEGIYANSAGPSSITCNTFNANLGADTGVSGIHIYSEFTDHLTIDHNAFTGNVGGAANNPIIFGATKPGVHKNLTVSNNTLNNDYGILALAINVGRFTGNTIVTNDATDITFDDNNQHVTVDHNVLNSARGVRVRDGGYGLGDNADIHVNRNSLAGNTNYGVGNEGGYGSLILDALCNWWGSTSGPSGPGGTGFGVGVTTFVDFLPWLVSSDLNGPCGPDQSITKTHRGQFKQLWFGTYTIRVTNAGGGRGTGMVTVHDTLPWSLFAIKMWGSGWNCNQGTRTCTRSDALAPGDSYPPIYLKVFVGVDISLLQTNVATVSNSLDTTSGNNTAFDPTTITPWTASLFFFF